MQRFDNFHDAFHQLITTLLYSPLVPAITSKRSVASQFGEKARGTQEILAHSFIISNPRDRLLPCRGIDERYAVANFFWTMAEVGNLEAITHYNPRGEAFAEDSELKCAIPDRMKNSKGGSQLDDAINLLRNDPSSRRALVTFTRPEDIEENALDFPCPATIQFLIRNNRLIAIVNMRAQSAYGVLPYDVYLFTLMQEAVAFELGIELGDYIHISNSLHIYEDEILKAASLSICQSDSFPMEHMADSSPISDKHLLELEESIRLTNDFQRTDSFYWNSLLVQLIEK